MSDFTPAIDQIAMVHQGKKDAHELTIEALSHIDAIDRNGYQLNSILALSFDALENSEKINPALPLAGIPIVIKDNVEAVGLPASAGSLALRDFPVKEDSTIARRLRKAGANIIGATNLSEWANIRSPGSTSGWSALGGLTANPWKHPHSAGGSSSGSGAVIAAGLVALAVGSETDGSIVCPASLNGCVGIKPTVGSIPRDGMVPISSSQDSPGPMARTVADTALLLEVMMSARGFVDAAASNFSPTIGFVKSWTTNHDGTNALLMDAVSKLSSAGLTIVEIDAPTPDDSVGLDEFHVLLHELFDDLGEYLTKRCGGSPQSLADVVAFNNANSTTELQHFGQEYFDLALELGGRGHEYLAKRTRNLDWATSMLNKAFTGVDVLIGATYAPAWMSNLGGSDDHSGASWITTAPSITGDPVGCLPMGITEGLPVGLGIVAPAYEEEVLVASMARIEKVLDIGILQPSFLR
ncbi:MAG: amidase family protein [Actinomycetes bacterium]